MVLGLCFGLATAAMAAEGTTTVTVTVNSIDELTVPETVAITLEAADAENPSKYATGTATDGSQLTYSHNSTTSKKITATATGPEPTNNNITLKVTVDSTKGPVEVVSEGVPVTEDVDVWVGIAAGGYEKDLTWTADASLAGTPAADYTFTVTFTTADVEGT